MRLAVIIPWAASVVMTTLVVYYGLEPYFGIINTFLVDVGLVDTPEGYGWTKHADTAFAWSIAIAVFVSLPFTTYTILAGLQRHPGRGARGRQDGRREPAAHLLQRRAAAAARRARASPS